MPTPRRQAGFFHAAFDISCDGSFGPRQHWLVIGQNPASSGLNAEMARAAMERAIQKLPIKAKFVIRPGTHGTPEVTI